MPQQTLICNVGARAANSTANYDVTPTMSSEVPNGTTLPAVSASVKTDDAGPVTSNTTSVTAASQLRWDLSKNGTAVQDDSGPTFGPGPIPCEWDNSVGCIVIGYPVTLSAPSQGKGAEPVGNQPITFTDDLSAAALFPSLNASQIAAINADPAKYGVRLTSECGLNPGAYNVPGMKIGMNPTDTAASSVRDSGTVTCTQAGGPGTAVEVSIANADTSLFTYPTNFKTYSGGDGSAIPTTDAFAISTDLRIEIPTATIADFGINVNGIKTLTTKNTYTNLSITGINPSDQQSGDARPGNDYRTLTPTVRPAGDFNKYFVGNPNDTAINTPPAVFSSGDAKMEGPPGGSTLLSGTINAAPTQTVISQLALVGSDISNSTNVSIIGCDTWDNTKLQLQAGNYQGLLNIDTSAPTQYIGSNGNAAWLSGFYGVQGGTGVGQGYATDASQLPAYTVEYGTGTAGAGANSTCGDADSPTGWTTDPASIAGNDPTLAAQGIYSAVTRVRIHVDLPMPYPAQTYQTEAFGAIALRVVDNATAGEVLPNWASAMFSRTSWATQSDMLANLSWNQSTYDPGTAIGNGHTGGPGDRLIAAPAFPRISKTVKGPHDADFNSSTPATTAGDTVLYKLAPSLTSAATGGTSGYDVWVEDCLPGSQEFMSADLTPTLVSVGSTPADAKIAACAADDTYLRWDLGARVPNQPITPIIVTVLVSPIALDGTYQNDVVISSDEDSSTLAQRTASAEIQVQSPAGIKLDKQALTPVTQVNRVGQATNELNKWNVSIASVNGGVGVTNPDVIDVLPKQGLSGTSFNGTFQFVSAAVKVGGANVTVQYTDAGTVNQDPNDASNQTGGSTVWCSAIGGGAGCPATAADVTGVRIGRPGTFASGDVITVEIDLVGVGNKAGDVYDNTAFARVNGLVLPVGPITRAENVVGSSVGDFVWLDSNKNGAQDSGEPGIDSFPVSISGTDDLGNSVSATTTTAGGGKYLFDSLRAGTYTVTFNPSGLTTSQNFTTQDASGVAANLNSDGSTTTGVTAAIALPLNTQNLDIDQGVISNTVTPTIATTINKAAPNLGDTLSDSVVVNVTGGGTFPGTWQLVGPVPAVSGSCTGANWAGAPVFDSGTFSANGNGTPTTTSSTNPLTTAGCYSFVDSLPTTGTTDAVTTAAGAVTETAIVNAVVLTQISAATAQPGATLSDTVAVAGVGANYTGAVQWQLLGPVAAVGGSCASVSWTGAAVFDSGSVPVTTSGNYPTASTNTLVAAGCYTFVDALTADGTVTAVSTSAGLASETAMVGALTPTVTTTISSQAAPVGSAISDTIAVSGSFGATATGTWTLLGPVAALSSSCAAVNWTGAATAATGTFSVNLTNGSGNTSTAPQTLSTVGCYTYVESLDATPATPAVPTSAPGIVAETTLISLFSPTVVTAASAVIGKVGDSFTDAVTVANSSGAASTITWTLLGPVPATAGSCPAQGDAAWASAAVLATGTGATTGDGTFSAPATAVTLPAAGCFTFVDALAATAQDNAVATTAAGIAGETIQATTWTPQLSTVVSAATVTTQSVHDTLTITNSGGFHGAIDWTLLGPVAANADGSCTSLDWTGAASVASGTVTITGDGTYPTAVEALSTDGCYTYVTTFPKSASTDKVSTQAGEATETIKRFNPAPGLRIVKTATLNDADGDGLAEVGETIVYQFVITNIGNEALTGVGVADPKLVTAGIAVTCPQSTLAIGAHMTCQSDPYPVTQADEDAGAVQNVATANGCDGVGTCFTSPGSSVSTPTQSKTLAFTGGDLETPLWVGFALIVLGSLLVFLTRRRRTN